MIRVFEIDENRTLRINEHTYLVPELKAIIDKHTDPIPALKYVYLMTVPDSPYANLEAEEKQRSISEDVGGEFSLDDPEIAQAMEKLAKLWETPTMRFRDSIRRSVDEMSLYLSTTKVTAGRDGNLADLRQIYASAGKTIESLKQLDKAVDEEMKVAMRGKGKMGMY